MQIEWFNTADKLPENEEKVLVILWGEIKTAKFAKGISQKEREQMNNGELPNPLESGWCIADGFMTFTRSRAYKAEDENGNNLMPYCWYIDGHNLFGQDIKWWAKLPDLKKYE